MSQANEAVVVSGRVRLARNYFDLPFSNIKNPENAQLCIERAQAAVADEAEGFTLYKMKEMAELDQQKLVEKHLISRDLLKHADAGAALIRDDKHVSIMVNEEDHLRIQAIRPGFDLVVAAQDAFSLESKLESVCTFSFDPQLGYLTSCPTNTGTGMRASLMMHLPLLTRYKQMGNVNQNVAKLGLTIRGIYGEGSDALGDLYQVSNQVTLGRTEEEIIEAVTGVGRQLIGMETALRERAMKEKPTDWKDALWRSYGILRYAVKMDEKEFMQHWSHLRLGTSMGIFHLSLKTVDDLLTVAQEAHAQRYAQEFDAIESADEARCMLIRGTLQNNYQEE